MLTRTCIGCGAKRSQRELLRIVSSCGAPPRFDGAGGAPGRGAYVCPQETCIETAWKRRAVERALKTKEAAPQELKAELRSVASLTG